MARRLCPLDRRPRPRWIASAGCAEARPGLLRARGGRAAAAVVLELVPRRRDPAADAEAAGRGRHADRDSLDPCRRRRRRRRPREGARGGRDGVQPEPRRQPPKPGAAGAVERRARQARRDQARLLPARDRLAVDPARGRDAGEPGPAAGRVHARGRAVPGLGRRARAAQGARLATARGRVDDARGLHRHAGLGGEPGRRVRAAAGRAALAPAARGRAARVSGS